MQEKRQAYNVKKISATDCNISLRIRPFKAMMDKQRRTDEPRTDPGDLSFKKPFYQFCLNIKWKNYNSVYLLAFNTDKTYNVQRD